MHNCIIAKSVVQSWSLSYGGTSALPRKHCFAFLRLLEWHIKAGEGQGVHTGFLPCVKLILIQAENLSSTGKQKCTAFRDILLHKGPIYSIKILWPLCRVPLNLQGTSMAALWCGWSVFSRTEIQPSIASNIGSFLQNVLLNRNHSTLLVCNSVLKMLFRNDT